MTEHKKDKASGFPILNIPSFAEERDKVKANVKANVKKQKRRGRRWARNASR